MIKVTRSNKPAISVFRVCALAASMSVFATATLYFAGVFNGDKVTAQAFVDLQQGSTVHAGFRRAHAKGLCVSGNFESTGLLSAYSTATVFKQGSTPFIGRFSIAGNNPTAPDLKAPVRSLAFVVNTATEDEWRVAMNTPPVMAVATPDAFYKQLQALSPDPATGKRDPAKISAFFKAHPESKAFNQWKAGYTPANSFATEQYNSINAFYLHNAQGEKQAVRWQAVPSMSEHEVAVLDKQSPDALQQQLISQIEKQPVRFDLKFTLADSNDDENNPTIPWPSSREVINAGSLVITGWGFQNEGACGAQNFDPLVLPKGMSATADPILRARGAAYAQSYRRRATETLLNKSKTSQEGAGDASN
ncbi:catalase family peroxidase [Pseudoalteromonas sp. H105]|uniref:catalase family peroxidase n=1 Tax=Pseudoalteromonas sp. H105 TaxID=1348393 RepID=UPI00073223C0|nr:catalase family peroxidase [Pseudoalteromonas sp. H105]KTF15642.1 catalase [Pseudoalteromonas sp. H105]